jgi:hypothetical protein
MMTNKLAAKDLKKSVFYNTGQNQTAYMNTPTDIDAYTSLVTLARDYYQWLGKMPYENGQQKIAPMLQKALQHDVITRSPFTTNSPLYQAMAAGNVDGMAYALGQMGTSHVDLGNMNTIIRTRVGLQYDHMIEDIKHELTEEGHHIYSQLFSQSSPDRIHDRKISRTELGAAEQFAGVGGEEQAQIFLEGALKAMLTDTLQSMETQQPSEDMSNFVTDLHNALQQAKNERYEKISQKTSGDKRAAAQLSETEDALINAYAEKLLTAKNMTQDEDIGKALNSDALDTATEEAVFNIKNVFDPTTVRQILADVNTTRTKLASKMLSTQIKDSLAVFGASDPGKFVATKAQYHKQANKRLAAASAFIHDRPSPFTAIRNMLVGAG